MSHEAAPEDRDPEHIVGRHGRLVRRTILVSLLTLLSRVLGLVREAGTAAVFGDKSAVADALVTAWRLPNLFRRLLGEGALATSLQTALTEVDHRGGSEPGRALFADTLRVAVGVLSGVCAVVMAVVALAPSRMPLTGWPWMGPDAEALRELSLLLMPYVVLVCAAALMSGALQVRGEFARSNAAPIALNLVWVAVLGALWWRWDLGDAEGGRLGRERELELARILSVATLAAGLFQVALLLPALRRHGLWFAGVARATTARARELGYSGAQVFRASAPLALGAAVYQINVAVDGLMAQAMLPTGGPQAYNNATRIQQFPMGLVAIAATGAVFPSLKALGHLRRLDELRRLHDQTQLGICFVALPAMLGIAALAHPISELLFGHGHYGAQGIDRMAASLAVLAFVILPAGAHGLVTRVYYALGDFRSPVRVAIAMLALNLVLNAVFVAGFHMDANGLALATVTASWIGLAALWPGLRRRLGLPPAGIDWLGRLGRMLVAASACGATAYGLFRALAGATSSRRALAVGVAIAGGVAVYALASHVLRIPEWQHLLARLSARLRGATNRP